MKRAVFILLILVALSSFYAPSFSLEEDLRAVEDCPVYEEKNSAGEIIYTLPKNQKVTVKATETVDSVTWYKIETTAGDGYVEASRLYNYRPPVVYTYRAARASAQKAGDSIYLYSEPGGEAVETVYDGASITVIEEQGEYSVILYQNKKYYIKSENVSAGLTYYQRTALIIGCVALAAVSLICILAYINKNKVSGKVKK